LNKYKPWFKIAKKKHDDERLINLEDEYGIISPVGREYFKAFYREHKSYR
jgi:hypothetical protein